MFADSPPDTGRLATLFLLSERVASSTRLSWSILIFRRQAHIDCLDNAHCAEPVQVNM